MDDAELSKRFAVLREAVDRADNLASTQARLIATQQGVIELQAAQIRRLESELREALCLHS
jgi:hypothetical protein